MPLTSLEKIFTNASDHSIVDEIIPTRLVGSCSGYIVSMMMAAGVDLIDGLLPYRNTMSDNVLHDLAAPVVSVVAVSFLVVSSFGCCCFCCSMEQAKTSSMTFPNISYECKLNERIEQP